MLTLSSLKSGSRRQKRAQAGREDIHRRRAQEGRRHARSRLHRGRPRRPPAADVRPTLIFVSRTSARAARATSVPGPRGDSGALATASEAEHACKIVVAPTWRFASFCAGSRVSFRFAPLARDTRVGSGLACPGRASAQRAKTSWTRGSHGVLVRVDASEPPRLLPQMLVEEARDLAERHPSVSGA